MAICGSMSAPWTAKSSISKRGVTAGFCAAADAAGVPAVGAPLDASAGAAVVSAAAGFAADAGVMAASPPATVTTPAARRDQVPCCSRFLPSYTLPVFTDAARLQPGARDGGRNTAIATPYSEDDWARANPQNICGGFRNLSALFGITCPAAADSLSRRAACGRFAGKYRTWRENRP